jgi:hypothetical protein
MGIPEGRGDQMDGSHMGKVIFVVPIKIKIGFKLTVPWSRSKYLFNFQYIFFYLGLTKTNLVSNSLTERARGI